MTGLTITTNSTAGYNLGSAALNPVTVAAGVTITDVGDPGLGSALATYWTIVNFGTLLATGKSGASDGVLLSGGGGAITNAASGSVTGYYVGVSVAGSGTVVNQGLIATGNTSGIGYNYVNGVLTPTTIGVVIGGGGVSNAASGMIASYLEGVGVEGGGSVVNAGTVTASSTAHGFGIVLTAGGSATNAQGGTVTAGLIGVLATGQTATVVNQGSIRSQAGAGVDLIGGGGVSNASTGSIYGKRGGVGSHSSNDLTVTNAAGGTIAGGKYGVYAENGGADTVTNAGSIIGASEVGVFLASGGTIANEAVGQISGYLDGVVTSGTASSTVINTGYISDGALKQGAGVELASGGMVTNGVGGVITSQWMGVQIGFSTTTSVAGTVTNLGTIRAADIYGDGAGVWIHGPGAVINAPSGLISGGAFGVVAYYQTTVVNQGTIFGTEFAFDQVHTGFADRIVDTPGAVFSGTVSGGNTLGSAVYSTLELASGSSTGTIVNAGTFVDFGRIALDAGATWSLGGSIVAGETVAFGGTDASLILASPSAAAATIAGFAASDTIVLAGITDVTGLSFDSGNTLTVAESGDAGLTLRFEAPLNLQYAVTDGSTDLIVVPCFLPGTHILTDRGEVPVEKLLVGDTVVTLGGRTRRLCWIGQGRALATRGRRSAATPVIVRKGALADNVPHRDLRVTKGHSLYLDGVLVPVEFLVNHRSILWDDRAQEVTVFHLELDAHDVLLANGAAAESYRDDGNRWLFQNANAGWDQPPKPPCAPVLTGGPEVDTIWQRLLDRAGPRPGVPLTDDPDLHLIVDGERVDAVEHQGSVLVFRLARRPDSVRIASRDAVPAELGLARDARSLGVALRRVAIRQGTRFAVLKASDARLADGFYPYEAAGELRWTNGQATLPMAVFAGFEGSVEVVLHLAATTQYPDDRSEAAWVAA